MASVVASTCEILVGTEHFNLTICVQEKMATLAVSFSIWNFIMALRQREVFGFICGKDGFIAPLRLPPTGIGQPACAVTMAISHIGRRYLLHHDAYEA